MANLQRLLNRFAELESEIAVIEATKRNVGSENFRAYQVNVDHLITWSVKSKHLISISCRPDSEHYRAFEQAYNGMAHSNNHDAFRMLSAIFRAAKDDFEGGYITSIQAMVQADVFASELDQARELLNGGYTTAAAVIAGVVLETSLRDLCSAHGLSLGNLNKMNTDLHKAGVYHTLVFKRIVTISDIRNSAAHGHPDRFTKDDVIDMIRQVENFLTDHV